MGEDGKEETSSSSSMSPNTEKAATRSPLDDTAADVEMLDELGMVDKEAERESEAVAEAEVK